MSLGMHVEKQIKGEGVPLLGPKTLSKLTLLIKMLKQNFYACKKQ